MSFVNQYVNYFFFFFLARVSRILPRILCWFCSCLTKCLTVTRRNHHTADDTDTTRNHPADHKSGVRGEIQRIHFQASEKSVLFCRSELLDSTCLLVLLVLQLLNVSASLSPEVSSLSIFMSRPPNLLTLSFTYKISLRSQASECPLLQSPPLNFFDLTLTGSGD